MWLSSANSGFLQTWCFVKISVSGSGTEPWSNHKVISGDNFQVRKGRKGNLKMCLNFIFKNLFFPEGLPFSGWRMFYVSWIFRSFRDNSAEKPAINFVKSGLSHCSLQGYLLGSASEKDVISKSGVLKTTPVWVTLTTGTCSSHRSGWPSKKSGYHMLFKPIWPGYITTLQPMVHS